MKMLRRGYGTEMEKGDTNFLCVGYFIKETGHQHNFFRFHPVHIRLCRLGPLIHLLPEAKKKDVRGLEKCARKLSGCSLFFNGACSREEYLEDIGNQNQLD